jgi:GxxExxY protein
MAFEPLSQHVERVGKSVVDAAFSVHTSLGPGLLEKVYEKCMVEELRLRNIHVERQVPVPIVYKGVGIDEDLKIDLLVEHEIIVELKAVETMHPVFDAQLLTYLKLTNRNLGYLINFNVPLIKDGIKRLRRNT